MELKNTSVLKVFVIVVIVAFLGYFIARDASGGITGGFAVDTEEDLSNENAAGLAIVDEASKIIKNANNEDVTLHTMSMISDILDLREASSNQDIVLTARYITVINEGVDELNVPEITYAWNDVLNCVYESCSNQIYISLIDQIVTKDLVKDKNKAIHSLVSTYSYWKGKTIIQFSESLSTTDEAIQKLSNSDVNSKWKELLKCNGKCEDFESQVFSLIRSINSA